jgi:hypothetical protein
MNLRRSRSLGPTRGFRFPLFIYIQDPSMSTVPWSEVRPYSSMLTVTLCATPTPAYNHQFLFFSSTDAILLQAVLPLYTGRTQVGHVVITLRTRTNPPPLSCARAFHSPIAVV